jgi:DNA polymerase-3 subunit delta
VISACNSYSLFGDGAFVVLRNLDAWNAAQKAKIVEYLKNPSPETDLVLIGKKLGAREKLLSAVKEAGEVYELDQPTGKALVKWLAGYARDQGVSLPDPVAQDLITRCSSDKRRLARESEKISLYVAADGREEATLADVAALCPPDLQSNIFAFVDALAAGDRGQALNMLEALSGSGEPPLRLAYMVRRQFQMLARSASLRGRGSPQKEIASTLKVPPFVAKKLEDQGRRLGEDDMERALETITHLELGLKGGSDLSDELQMERAMIQLSARSGN